MVLCRVSQCPDLAANAFKPSKQDNAQKTKHETMLGKISAQPDHTSHLYLSIPCAAHAFPTQPLHNMRECIHMLQVPQIDQLHTSQQLLYMWWPSMLQAHHQMPTPLPAATKVCLCLLALALYPLNSNPSSVDTRHMFCYAFSRAVYTSVHLFSRVYMFM